MFVFDWSLHTPESQGIPSRQIIALIRYLQARELAVHGMIVLRNGKCVTEAYYAPWRRDSLHRLYSSGKSITAVAAGLLMDEGKLTLTDPLYRFFPEIPEEEIHPFTRRVTVYDALTMQMCFSSPPYAMQNDAEWIRAFFRAKPDHPPGLLFYYDTSAAQMLAEIIKRVSGKPFYRYLRDRVGEKDYLKTASCVQAPDGSEFAGSGLRCTARDFAMTAEMMCAGGCLQGRRVLSEQFARDAVRPHAVNNLNGNTDLSSVGYGYQIWCGKNCFMFKGMATQFAVCFPEERLTAVFLCNTRGYQAAYEVVYSAVRTMLLSSASPQALPENPAAHAALKSLLSGPECTLQSGAKASPMAETVSGAVWQLTGRIPGIDSLRVDFDGNEGTLTWHNRYGEKMARFGMGFRVPFLFREHHADDPYVGVSPVEAYTCYGTAHWAKENQLRIKIEFEGMFMGMLVVNLAFLEDELAVYVHHDIDFFPDHWFLKDYRGFDAGKRCRQADTITGNGGSICGN